MLILLINVAVNAVLFLPGEFRHRESIEAGYASMGRFLSLYPDPWGWKPLQYCGLPTQFAYLPVLPYLTALFIWMLPSLEPEHVYRILTVTLTCLGPVTVFAFALYFTGRRGWAVATALAYTFFSPAFLLLPHLRNEPAWITLPWRWHVQVKFGEAPHNAGLTLLPLAVIAAWSAAQTGRRGKIFAASALFALIALTNWISALALAWCCFCLLISIPGGIGAAGFRGWRLFAVAGLAWLFACFWLTPDFIRTVAFNWPVDAFNFQMQTLQKLLLAGLFAGVILLRFAFHSLAPDVYHRFLGLAFYGFACVSLAHYIFGVDPIPEARRYLPEAEMFLFLLSFELLRLIVGSPYRFLKVTAAIAALFALALSYEDAWRYATQTPHTYTPYPREQTVEYRTAHFLADQRPAGRVFVTGGTRFHLNSWFDLPQPGGTFETGLNNRAPLHLGYQIVSGLGNAPGREGHTAVMQLKALGVEYVAVHGPNSKEFYRDFRHPRKFESLLEKVYEQDDDFVYRVPFSSYAHLVRRDELPPVLPVGENAEKLQPYVAAMEDPARPGLRTAWLGASAIEIEGPFPERFLVSLLITHDPGWQAVQQGHGISIEKDALGYMLLRPRPAAHSRIELRYRGARQAKALAGVSAAAWLAALGAFLLRRRSGPQ